MNTTTLYKLTRNLWSPIKHTCHVDRWPGIFRFLLRPNTNSNICSSKYSHNFGQGNFIKSTKRTRTTFVLYSDQFVIRGKQKVQPREFASADRVLTAYVINYNIYISNFNVVRLNPYPNQWVIPSKVPHYISLTLLAVELSRSIDAPVGYLHKAL